MASSIMLRVISHPRWSHLCYHSLLFNCLLPSNDSKYLEFNVATDRLLITRKFQPLIVIWVEVATVIKANTSKVNR